MLEKITYNLLIKLNAFGINEVTDEAKTSLKNLLITVVDISRWVFGSICLGLAIYMFISMRIPGQEESDYKTKKKNFTWLIVSFFGCVVLLEPIAKLLIKLIFG